MSVFEYLIRDEEISPVKLVVVISFIVGIMSNYVGRCICKKRYQSTGPRAISKRRLISCNAILSKVSAWVTSKVRHI